MARIRSVHPGQATDEDFVELSYPAMVATILLRCHADDNGVFEWKPKALKMKIFPAANVDMAAILSELEAHNQVRKYEADGRQYGAIRNFRTFQRPKSPKTIHPLPCAMEKYVGTRERKSGNDDTSEEDISEPLPKSGGTDTEISPQREEVGGRREEDSAPVGARRSAPEPPRLADLRGPPDKLLFSEGLAYLERTYQRPAPSFRPLVGKWLQSAKNDHEAVWRELADLEGRGTADPIAAMMARFAGKGRNAVMAAFDELGRELAE